MKSPLTLVLSIIALVGVVGVPLAFAQSADWNLTVNFTSVPYGTDKIHLTVKGPFSSSPIVDQSIPTGPNPTTTVTITGSDVPQGYEYYVCASSTATGYFIPTCESFTHGQSDETVEITPN